MARKADTRASHSLTPDPLTRPPAHPPARLRRPRLRLDELEPRVAPSSLLYNLALLGAWGMEHGAWSETRDFAENATPPTRPDAHTPTQSLTIPSEGFAPVVPSQLGPADGESQSASGGPNPRFQTDLNEPGSNGSNATPFGYWALTFGVYLEFGAWDLELPGAPGAADSEWPMADSSDEPSTIHHEPSSVPLPDPRPPTTRQRSEFRL